MTRGLRSGLDGRAATQDDQIGQRDVRPGLRLDALQRAQHTAELVGIVGLPADLRLEADPGAIGATALVAVAIGRGRGPGGRHQLGDAQARLEDFALERSDVGITDRMARWDRVLPDELLLRHLWAEVPADRAHVAMQQLEPGTGERVRELVGVLEEPARDLLVHRVHTHRHVGGRHHRSVLQLAGRGVGHGVLATDRRPLLRSGGALGELPFVAEERLEVAVVPLRRRGGPGTLDPARRGVGALARGVGVLPTETHLLEGRTLGLGSHEVGVARAVRLAERVTSGGERDGLLVVHRHPGERLADVTRRCQRVGVAVRALGIDVDQAHLDRAERVVELTITAVALVAEPRGLGTPVDVVLGRPHVGATTREAERLETHRLERDVAGEAASGRPTRSGCRTSA